jgi:hypothetical protein
MITLFSLGLVSRTSFPTAYNGKYIIIIVIIIIIIIIIIVAVVVIVVAAESVIYYFYEKLSTQVQIYVR